MVKYLATKRTSKKVTLEDVKKTKVEKVIRHFHLEEKVEKRHRFKTSKEERAMIDINLQRRMEDIHIEQRTDVDGSYFKDIIELKRTAMAGPAEKKYLHEAYLLAQNLPQVLLNLPQILELAYTFFGEKSCKNVVLETINYLIKDCRQEFYPHIPLLYEQIAKHLNIEDVPHLEKGFLTIAYSIKYLEKQILNDADTYFQLINDIFFISPFHAIRKLAGEALGYLFRKNRNLINLIKDNYNLSAFAYGIFVSVQALHNYLATNTVKFLDQVWNKDNEQLIIEIYKLIIENVSELPHKLLISLGGIFEDLKNRPKFRQIILLELFKFKKGRKVNQQIMSIVINQAEDIELIALMLKLGFYVEPIESVICNNAEFISKIIYSLTFEELNQIVQILFNLDAPQKKPQLYRLIIAAIFQQLFNQKEEALDLLIKLDQIHCIDKLTPEKLEEFLRSPLFDQLLRTNDSHKLLGLCKLYSLVQLNEEIQDQIQLTLKAKLFSFKMESREIDYSQFHQMILTTKRQLSVDDELALIVAEQSQQSYSIEDGIIIRLLDLYLNKQEFTQFFNNQGIHYHFGKDNLQTKEMIEMLPGVSQQILEVGLMSRKRLVRLACAQQLFKLHPSSEELKLMISIDQNKCDLDNERFIKGNIINLRNLVKHQDASRITRFAFGLAFNKFSLIKGQIRELLSVVLPKSDYLKIFLFQQNVDLPKKQLSYLEKYLHMEAEEEQCDSLTCFEEVFAPAILTAEFEQQDKNVLYDIGVNNLMRQMQKEKDCLQITDYHTRRYGDKKSQFYLKLLSHVMQITEYDQLKEIFMHWLLKDDDAIQGIALSNIQSLELLKQPKDYHQVIKEFFDGLRNLVDGKTFRSETVKFSIEVPNHLMDDYKQYALYAMYPKIFSRTKLSKKKNKNSAIQIRRNAVFELLSNFQVEDQLIELIAMNHGLDKEFNTIPVQIKIQYLKILKNLIDKLGYQIKPDQVKVQLNWILRALNEAYELKQNSNVSHIKELWKVAIKRFNQIVQKYNSEQEYTTITLQILQESLGFDSIKQGFTKIVEDSKFQPSGILKLLTQIANVDVYHQFLIDNHELMLSRFFELYRLTYEAQIKPKEEDDGRLVYEIRKQTSKRIGQQKNVLSFLNSILFAIFQVEGVNDNLMEVEHNNLTQTVSHFYGEQILNSLYENLMQNGQEGNGFIILRDQKCLYLFHLLLQNTKEISEESVNKYLGLLSKAVGNGNIYDSNIHKLNVTGKLINYCIKSLLPKAKDDCPIVEELFESYSKLLLTIKSLSTRLIIIDVIQKMVLQFQNKYPINVEIAALLSEMNIRNQITDELHFDRCLEACMLAQKYIHEVEDTVSNCRAIHLLLQNAFFLAHSNELSIRIAVQEMFKAYFQRRFGNKDYLDRFLLPQLIQMFSTTEESTMKCGFSIFEQHLLNLDVDPLVQKLLDNEPISCTDLEFKTRFAEFKILFLQEPNLFNQIFDIQMPARIKAMQLLETRIESMVSNILIDSYSQVILPLLEFNIFAKGSEIGNQKNKITDSNKSHYLTFSTLCIKIYGDICREFNFERRITILQRLTKKLEKLMLQTTQNSFLIQAMIKTIQSVAQNKDSNYDVVQLVSTRLQEEKSSQLQDFLKTYFFEEAEENTDVTDFEFSYKNLIAQERDLAKAREVEKKDISNQIWNKVIDITVNEIQDWQDRSNILLKLVYLPLKNLFLVSGKESEDKYKLLLSNALVEIITQLPPDTFMTELNRLVGRLCRGLKNRDNDLREESRRALLELSNKIGSTFLKFILIQMKSTLTQGFENHVLSYTTGLLVEQMSSNVGQLDYCMEDIMEIFLEEVFGMVGSEKEEQNLPKKTKEIKSKKGIQNFRMVGRIIDFVSTLPTLIGIMDNYITKKSLSHQLTSKLKLVFDHLFLGLCENPTIPKNPIPVLYLMIAETSHKVAQQLNALYSIDFTLDQNLQKQSKQKKVDIMSIQLPSFGLTSIVQYMKENKLKTDSSHIFTQTTLLSIRLLHHHIKQNQIEDSIILQRIFKVILDCLTYSDMVSECVAVLCALIRVFPWVTNFKKQILTNAMQSISKLTSTDEAAVRDSFNLLKAILDSKLNEFTAGQQKTLVHFIDLYLDHQEALECLRIIIHQVWPLPQIYDIVMRVRETMLQTQKKQQNTCRTIYLQFLIKYPLSSQVLQQHFDFLLANLNYKYSCGRTAVYQCLQQIFENFPSETIQKLGDISYFSLIAAYVKEDSLKDGLNEVLKALVGQLPRDKIQQLSQHSVSWMMNVKLHVSISGLESLRILNQKIDISDKIWELVVLCNEDWQQWKSNIQAKNIQSKNLKDSEWANELETITVTDYPEQNPRTYSLLQLILSLDQQQIQNLFTSQSNMICTLLNFTMYPNQESANLAMKLFIKHERLPILNTILQTHQEELSGQLYKYLKYFYLIKYVRNKLIIDPELTNEFIRCSIVWMKELQLTELITSLFDAFLKVTSNLMAKSNYLVTAIQNFIQCYVYLLSKQIQPQIQIVQSISKLQGLQMELPQLEQVTKLLEKAYGSSEFARIYQKINSSISQLKRQKRMEIKEKAIQDPEQFYQIKQKKNFKKKVQKKVKIQIKRGKIPL